MGPFHEKLGGGKTFHQKSSRMGGGAHKMGGGQMISPKNGGSVDAIVNFWGECNSNVIFMGGVWSHFMKIWGEAKHFIKKVPEWGGTLLVQKIGALDAHFVYFLLNIFTICL